MHDGLPDDFLDEVAAPTTTALEWSPQQKAAIEGVDRWLDDPASQVYHLFGYAGTGKTTLARECAKRAGGGVLFGAFTGKAALILRQKGCAEASTIHRMIYNPKDKSAVDLVELREKYRDELLREVEKPDLLKHEAKCRALAREIATEERRLKQPAFAINPDSEVRFSSLVVIDEVSMVGRRMGEDLLSFGTKVLVLGDPAQLPPIADGGFFIGNNPDTLLTEIHRQAAGSPVIELATAVREGRGILDGTYGDSVVAPKGSFDIHEIAAFDQILCGRNNTRRVINRRVREEVLGRETPLPVVGDRLVCLRNNHELGLLNGSLWDVESVQEIDGDELVLGLLGEEGQHVDSIAHVAPFLGKELSYFERRNADEFDYGYALTCHKAQGSQWGSVFVVDEGRCFGANAGKWLYTAITRAASRVTIVR